MEVDQQNLVLVETDEEEKEVSLQSRHNSAVAISSNAVHSQTTKGFLEDATGLLNSVYFDQNNGLWKCRHCEWTYCMGSQLIDLNLNLRGYFHMPMHVKTFNEKQRCFNFETEVAVTKSVGEGFEMKNGSIPGFTFGTNSRDVDVNSIKDSEKDESLIAEMNECRNFLGNGLSDSILLTALKHGLEEQTMKSNSFNNGTTGVGDFNSIKEVDQGGTEFDVEKVLEKQNTHDLYCPNCNSCITRRVILRRKQIRIARRKTKYNKVEANFPSDLDAVSTNGSNVQVHETVGIHSSDSPALAADNHNSGRESEVYVHSSDTPALAADNHNSGGEPEVFRCLACFSFFIPTGDGFKPFRFFGDNSLTNNVQDLQKTPAGNSNWFSSIFRTDKNKLAVEQGNVTEPYQHGLFASTASPSLGLVSHMGRVSEQAREKIVISSTEDNKYFENISTNMREKSNSATVKPDADSATSNYFISTVQEENKEGDQAAALPGIPVTEATAEDASKRSPRGGMNSPVSSTCQRISIPEEETTGNKVATFIATESKHRGDDVIVIVETSSLDPAVSQTRISQGNDGSMEVSSTLQTGTPIYTSEGAGVTLDILKSIVYGGLIESITSLGVVSSAAGAGSTTLNILALGLANLMGGLFIIGHNLIELKNDTSSVSSNEMIEREGHYEATLGRREKFSLHATVAIISFLIFGMLAPVIYSFSFRKSDDKDLKLAVVGGVSVVCILLLAMGKVYVRRPPKAYMSTVLYYVMVGIMISGVSYVVGDLISKVMGKLGWFDESGLAIPIIVPGGRKPSELEWASN
ncbi:membrane protein of ER body-like protein isoform X3 [Euphorbia lathyris]|uniref:membrane protein of ER body-like protein isoform X3 n=1 Tax=Euphorbia lathyris TaxID=212925 RepID=UPI0033138915